MKRKIKQCNSGLRISFQSYKTSKITSGTEKALIVKVG